MPRRKCFWCVQCLFDDISYLTNNLADAAPTKIITRKMKTRKFHEEEEKDSDDEERFDGGYVFL